MNIYEANKCVASLITEATQIENNSEQRFGQASWNAVYTAYPKTSNRLRNTEFDPFYDDSKVYAFWGRVLFLLTETEENK